MIDSQREKFFEFLASSGVSLEIQQQADLWSRLISFSEILLAKNEQVNLTAIREPEAVLWKHFADSLVLARFEPMGNLCDWGSGGGFPGIPMALLRAVRGESGKVFLVDSIRKKTEAAASFVSGLSLLNCSSHWSRGEEFLKTDQGKEVNTICFRAVAPLAEISRWVSRGNQDWIFLLGSKQIEEIQNFSARMGQKGFVKKDYYQFNLPYDSSERAIVRYSKK